MTDTKLVDAWRDLTAALGTEEHAAQAVFGDLYRRYSEPGRFYHTLTHIAQVLGEIERGAPTVGATDLLNLRLAAWFHDVVYDSRAGDNEAQSAEYARETLGRLGLTDEITARVGQLILATKTHDAEEGDADCQLLLDADLAILGADEGVYRAYQGAIRKEYAWVPDEAYRAGRARVLGSFLLRPRIFRTPAFAALEERARTNLRHERRQLQP